MKRLILTILACLLVGLASADGFARGGRGSFGGGRARRTKSKKNEARVRERKEAQLRDSLRVEAARDRT
jgi:hypothetical protein